MSKYQQVIVQRISKVQYKVKNTSFVLCIINLLTLLLSIATLISIQLQQRTYVSVYTKDTQTVFGSISVGISLLMEIYFICFILSENKKQKITKEKNNIQGFNPEIGRNRIAFTYPMIIILVCCSVMVVGHEGLRLLYQPLDFIFVLALIAALMVVISLFYITYKLTVMRYNKKDFELPDSSQGTNVKLIGQL